MTNVYSGIRLFGDNAITMCPGLATTGNPICVDIARVNPEELSEPDAIDFIDRQVFGFPLRLFDTLHSEAGPNKTASEAFHFGLQAVGLEADSPEASYMRQHYDLQHQQSGDYREGLWVFEGYAQALVRGYTGEKVVEGLRRAFGDTMQNGDPALLEARKLRLKDSLDELPQDLVRAVDRLGTKVVIAETRNCSHFPNRTIYISQASFDGVEGYPRLSSVLKEEMIHYVDSAIGFTERPEWLAASQKGTKPYDKAIELHDTIVKESMSLEMIEAAIALLDRQAQALLSQTLGKKLNQDYDENHRATELLPDIVHAQDMFMGTGIGMGYSVEEAKMETTLIFGEDAVHLTEQFFGEVSQVADGTHPALMSTALMQTAGVATAETRQRPDTTLRL